MKGLKIKLPKISDRQLNTLANWIIDNAPYLHTQWSEKGFIIPQREVFKTLKSAILISKQEASHDKSSS